MRIAHAAQKLLAAAHAARVCAVRKRALTIAARSEEPAALRAPINREARARG